MQALWIKLGLFVAIWYEVSVELGISGNTALILTLLVCGGGMMLLRLPGQLLSMLGPRVVVLATPLAVWAGLAWWLMPDMAASYPVLTLIAAGLLAVAGAAAHYAVGRYPAWFARRRPALRALVVPAVCILLGLAAQMPLNPLAVAAAAVLLGLPLRLGWRFIGPVSPHKFDARMGDADAFRRAGFSDDV